MIPVKHLLITVLVCVSFTAYSQFKLYEKGHDSYKAGNYEDAVKNLTEYLTKATRDKAIDIDVFYIRALAHYKLSHFRDAIPDFEETLLRGHANKGNIYWFMAKCYDNLKNDDETLNSYNNAIRELKDKPESKGKLLYERSQVQYRMGKLDMAYADLKAGIEADPANADIKKELDKLEKDTRVAARQAEIGASSNKAAEKKIQGKNESTKQAVKSNENRVTENANGAKENGKGNEVKKETAIAPGKEGEPKNVSQNVAKTEVVKSEPAKPALSPLEELYKDEKRFALVIGNSHYSKEIGLLKNPVNDASDVAKELENSHFDVTLLTDATYGQIRAALMKFKQKLDGGDPEKTVGLFYFAGHGLQFDDENYLVPVDAMVEYEDDIPRYCFPINRMVLGNMEQSNTRMNIVILDACRNNPFPSLHRSLGNSGLGEMRRAKGSFIAYATAPGSVASDGAGRNGLYTQELLKAMKKEGLTIEQVFKEVRGNVLKLSNNKQNTWDSSNIIGEFHFKY